MTILYTDLKRTYSIEILKKPDLILNPILKHERYYFNKERTREDYIFHLKFLDGECPDSESFYIIKYNGLQVPIINFILNECVVDKKDGYYEIYSPSWSESYLL